MKLSSDESKELSRCSLSALPNEILLKTFKYLDLKTLCRMNEVNNRRFDILTRDPRLYTRLNMRDKSEKYMCDIFYYFTPRCKYLQQLDLKGSYFHVNDFINFLNNCGRRLTHLNLSYCTIHYSSTVFQLSFEISKTCKDLKELDLRFCQGMEYGIDVDNDDDEFLYLERLNNLECIMFSRLPITTENICKILQNNPQIREVDMGVSMNDEILITLANSCRDLEVIRTLFISTDGHITSQGISALANCKNLQKVHLIFSYKYPVNDDSLFRLFSSYQHLQEIHLFFPVLTDHRLELLAQCKNLKKLYLDCVKDLDDPDKYSIILKQCPKLQKFSLTRCNISDRLVDQWRERYPHVSVYTKN
ncbi:uncharacterized protein [Temnothorax nylanderi]|uniref:uncharacterized protein isoform X1 n=1 Tax=Temnothorax nylanderi TaxID=102681 RepID=UPI003A86F9EB